MLPETEASPLRAGVKEPMKIPEAAVAEHGTRLLEQRGVKMTPNRILVLRALRKAARPMSLAELEEILPTLDKSSIFRVLALFNEHHVTHAIEDGSGALKYEACGGDDACTLDDMHAHFYCESCKQTFCFKATHIPEINLPEGFMASSINYMVKGICPHCARKLR